MTRQAGGVPGADAVRVAHVVFDLDRGGMETVLVDLARSLHGTRFRLSVLVLSGRLGRAAQALAPFVDHIDTHRPAPGISMVAPLGIVRWLRRVGADVVHLHSGAWFKPALAARLAGVRGVIFTEHGRQHQRDRVKRFFDARAARLTDEVVAVTPLMVPAFAADIGSPESRLTVVMNGVDTDRYRPLEDDGALRAELSIPAGAPIIGSVGRYEHVKGCDVLLDAFEALLARHTGGHAPHLVMAGEGSTGEAIRARVSAHVSLARAVHVLPWRDDPSALYRTFDVFVMASRSEGTSISLLEALASGACPVVTAVGGNPLVLGPALAHRLVPPESAAALADALGAALADAPARERDARAARRRVETDFSVRAMTDAYASLYARLAARGA